MDISVGWQIMLAMVVGAVIGAVVVHALHRRTQAIGPPRPRPKPCSRGYNPPPEENVPRTPPPPLPPAPPRAVNTLREPTRDEMEAALSSAGRDETFYDGWTVRRCRHCGDPVAGGPTACLVCVKVRQQLEKEREGERTLILRQPISIPSYLATGPDSYRLEPGTYTIRREEEKPRVRVYTCGKCRHFPQNTRFALDGGENRVFAICPVLAATPNPGRLSLHGLVRLQSRPCEEAKPCDLPKPKEAPDE